MILFKFHIRRINSMEREIWVHRYQFSGPVEEAAYRDAVKNGKLIMATSPWTAADIYEMLEMELDNGDSLSV